MEPRTALLLAVLLGLPTAVLASQAPHGTLPAAAASIGHALASLALQRSLAAVQSQEHHATTCWPVALCVICLMGHVLWLLLARTRMHGARAKAAVDDPKHRVPS